MDGHITEKQQIARIAVLLDDLEALSRDAAQVPVPLLMQTLASIDKARSVLEIFEQFAEDQDDGDPQPEVDRDLLERMYRDLGVGRRPSPRR
jgi:hypothetical protein